MFYNKKSRKGLLVFLVFGLIAAVIFPAFTARGETGEGFDVTAPSAVLMEASTGTVLFEKGTHEVRPCASITKVMTLCLVFDAIDDGALSLTDTLSASAHASSMGGSDIWLKEGEQMTVDDLLKATVIMSANDAAVVLAESVAGSEDEFVRRMNEKAAELGMKDTVFKNCNGLDEDGHVTSAYDVALMSRELLKHGKIFDYTLTWIDYVRGGETQLVNTNKLIRSYRGITGLKTGTTSRAGSCITATAERDNLALIAVVLGAGSTDDRFRDAASLLDYGFGGWAVTLPETPEIGDVPVKCGMEDTVPAKANEQPKLLTRSSEKNGVEQKIIISEDIEAPVKKGDVVGRIEYILNGKTISEAPITADGDVARVTFKSSFNYLLRAFFAF